MRFWTLALSLAISCLAGHAASGIILLKSGEPGVNASTPGDNSGWQYEGQFGDFLGTPIAPHYFITAHHIGGGPGSIFTFHGQTYTVTDGFSDFNTDTQKLNTDLQIWKVDKAFPCYAPLYDQTNSEPGAELHVFGRGTQRGTPVTLDGTLRGWMWGDSDHAERWGTNIVTTIADGGPGYGTFLQAGFDLDGLPDEAHLSVGDSGGAVFLLENGLWRLAAINYAVDDLRTTADPSTAFVAAIFDARGFYAADTDGTYTLVPEDGPIVPTFFYSTQISARLAWIKSITGIDSATLPAENFSGWESGYFDPAQLADANISGPNADPDADGVPNLLEFAFSLDPGYAEPLVMTAGTGLRGLPLVRREAVAASDTRLTVEFVRRTAVGGSDVTYTVQFTSSLAPGTVNWQAGGTETVTSINARWERVKVTDSVSIGTAAPTRFARVAVAQNAESSALRRLPAVKAK